MCSGGCFNILINIYERNKQRYCSISIFKCCLVVVIIMSWLILSDIIIIVGHHNNTISASTTITSSGYTIVLLAVLITFPYSPPFPFLYLLLAGTINKNGQVTKQFFACTDRHFHPSTHLLLLSISTYVVTLSTGTQLSLWHLDSM